MLALAFSGGKDSMACLHLLREQLDFAIFVDTGFTYPETHAMVDYAASLIKTVHVVLSDRSGQNLAQGIPADVVPVEWTAMGQSMTCPKSVTVQSSISCCYENLALPLLKKAKELGVTHLAYGQRREEAHRGTARHGDCVDGIIRLHPVENWTTPQVFEYLATKMTIPAHFALTHSSLDCYDCTAFAKTSQDRIDWTKAQYPDYDHAYQIRANALHHALQEAR